MKVFIAGSLARKDILAWVQLDFQKKYPGIEFVSSWMYFETPIEYADWKRKGQLHKNLAELADADILVIDAIAESSSGGYVYEAGMARGKGIPILRVGDACNDYVKMTSLGFDRWSAVEEQLKLTYEMRCVWK